MSDTSAPSGGQTGLAGLGEPLQGTDARPGDEQRTGGPAADADLQGGDNEQQDEMRAQAAAQASDTPVTGGLDDSRASAREGSINDNSDL